jgi:hypothetical protein
MDEIEEKNIIKKKSQENLTRSHLDQHIKFMTWL